MGDQRKLFGAELRRVRLAAGLSLGELARIMHYSKGYLSKIETGRKPATVDLARRCDAALGTNGRLGELVGSASPDPAASGIAPPGDQGTVPPGDQKVDGEVWMMSLSPRGAGWFAPMNRGDGLSTGAAALLPLGVTRFGGSAATRRETTYDAFASMFELHRRFGRAGAGRATGPGRRGWTVPVRHRARVRPEASPVGEWTGGCHPRPRRRRHRATAGGGARTTP